MSCQPCRVTSGHSNSGHKQIHISKLFSHIYQPSVKSVYKTNQFANIKHIYTQTSDINFRRVSPFNITPVKRAHKARACWYRRPFRVGKGGQKSETSKQAPNRKTKAAVGRRQNNKILRYIVSAEHCSQRPPHHAIAVPTAMQNKVTKTMSLTPPLGNN